MFTGNIGLSGHLSMKVDRASGNFLSRKWFSIRAWHVRQFLRYGWRELPWLLVILLAPILRRIIPGFMIVHSKLALRVIKANGEVWDYGTIGRHLITTAGKKYVASTFANTAEPEVFKYHAFGTGTTAAAVGDTALQTECTTAYATDNTRPTGSQTADGTVVTYVTVATFTPDASVATTEWGLMSQASNAGGTLLDRQVFSAVNLNGSGDSLQTTYTLTIG